MSVQLIESPGKASAVMTHRLTLLFAAACGLAVANIYYAQPLLDAIADEYGLQHAYAGLLVTVTQIGYGAGLVLLVPLGDLLNRRRLIVVQMLLSVASLSDTLSGYRVEADGRLRLLNADGVTFNLGAGHFPIDLKVSDRGQFLNLTNAGTGSVETFRIQPDGQLVLLNELSLYPPLSGMSGLAAK